MYHPCITNTPRKKKTPQAPTEQEARSAPELMWKFWRNIFIVPATNRTAIPRLPSLYPSHYMRWHYINWQFASPLHSVSRDGKQRNARGCLCLSWLGTHAFLVHCTAVNIKALLTIFVKGVGMFFFDSQTSVTFNMQPCSLHVEVSVTYVTRQEE
jgi:hypothetical protein